MRQSKDNPHPSQIAIVALSTAHVSGLNRAFAKSYMSVSTARGPTPGIACIISVCSVLYKLLWSIDCIIYVKTNAVVFAIKRWCFDVYVLLLYFSFHHSLKSCFQFDI